jgi:hypothetical protein
MADEKTAVTEIVTGLGASGASAVDSALAARPTAMRGVDAAAWSQVTRARLEGRHEALFALAWGNGRALFEATDGLRGRAPRTIEWKGPHKPPGYDSLPADLRVDHVYLVSCKYGSDISTNCSPSNLFDRLLAQRSAGSEPWYAAVAPEAYAAFYAEVRRVIGDELPASHRTLGADDIEVIRAACQRTWPEPLVEPWRAFSYQVASATAARWRVQLDSATKRELQLWRLLRLETSPYFVLGATKAGEPVRYRVATPWDWRQAYRFRSLDVSAAVAGQPLVLWRAVVEDRALDRDVVVEGEIEVRWSHGRFSAVEAKLHLKTPATRVPGYFPLV